MTRLGAPSTMARSTTTAVVRCCCVRRTMTTESVGPPIPPASSSSSQPSPSPSSPQPDTKARPSRLAYPLPRPAPTTHTPNHLRQTTHPPHLGVGGRSLGLPPTFGRNQLLPVSDSTRALLERIVRSFDAPVRYAFAYGSGVFGQAGYDHVDGDEDIDVDPSSSSSSKLPNKRKEKNKADKHKPMLDFIFAVNHPDHWHSINMHQYPGHYPLHARMLGSSFVTKVQEMGPGVWFNTYVPMHDVTIKYGVTSVDTLCADLLNWRTLYLAGRMHKPLRIIKDDARVRLTQQVNLTSALRTALLMLPSQFTQRDLFMHIASISYTGDPRMVLPAENRNKVKNVVDRQEGQFRELYWRLAQGLPGVRWSVGSDVVEQDVSAQARVAHMKKLPQGLLDRVHARMRERGGISREADEYAYWIRVAGDESMPEILQQEMGKIVRYPATVQTLKGVVSAGLSKSTRYATAKVGKWWKGVCSSSS
ncbi:mitochondrial matrix Mmp37-domain-containing protein [Pisolithus albus]|nr:mitochondrial matrix Mmp37-domain-containing protein [Pisolithus albus]